MPWWDNEPFQDHPSSSFKYKLIGLTDDLLSEGDDLPYKKGMIPPKNEEWTGSAWASLNAEISSVANKIELIIHKVKSEHSKVVLQDIVEELKFIRSDVKVVFDIYKQQ